MHLKARKYRDEADHSGECVFCNCISQSGDCGGGEVCVAAASAAVGEGPAV